MKFFRGTEYAKRIDDGSFYIMTEAIRNKIQEKGDKSGFIPYTPVEKDLIGLEVAAAPVVSAKMVFHRGHEYASRISDGSIYVMTESIKARIPKGDFERYVPTEEDYCVDPEVAAPETSDDVTPPDVTSPDTEGIIGAEGAGLTLTPKDPDAPGIDPTLEPDAQLPAEGDQNPPKEPAGPNEGSNVDGANKLTEIKIAIAQLDPAVDFTMNGTPKVESLTALLGFEITAQERNEAWLEYIEENKV